MELYRIRIVDPRRDDDQRRDAALVSSPSPPLSEAFHSFTRPIDCDREKFRAVSVNSVLPDRSIGVSRWCRTRGHSLCTICQMAVTANLLKGLSALLRPLALS